MGKKVVSVAGCVITMIGLGFASKVSGVTGQEVLMGIQNRYEETKDLRADFMQEYVGQIMRRPQKGEGKVFFKKKGMMRWDYRIPKQVLVSNGRMLWFYQPDEHQVFLSDISNVVKEKTPLAFLAGEGDLRRDFNLVGFEAVIHLGKEAYLLRLTPLEVTAVLAKLVLTVDKETTLVTQADVIDGLGNVTRTRFLSIKTNVDLPDSLFHFDIPPGTEILRGQASGDLLPEKGN